EGVNESAFASSRLVTRLRCSGPLVGTRQQIVRRRTPNRLPAAFEMVPDATNDGREEPERLDHSLEAIVTYRLRLHAPALRVDL
ncbi:MAG: hypothetical protein M9885_15985, partial [Burkholderiaceae bacterium]|nr:hypothetical protein [Burkholderiaceae bacterium]